MPALHPQARAAGRRGTPCSRRRARALRGGSGSSSDQLTGGIKLTMPVGELTDEALNFVGVPRRRSTSPPAARRLPDLRRRKAAWYQARRQRRRAPPWKEERSAQHEGDVRDVAGLKRRQPRCSTTSANAILGRPGRRLTTSKRSRESIRVARPRGHPRSSKYNWYALRAMGGYYEEDTAAAAHVLAAHDYTPQPAIFLGARPDVGAHAPTDSCWTALRAIPQGRRSRRRARPACAWPCIPTTRHRPRIRWHGPDPRIVDGLRRVCDRRQEPGQRHHVRHGRDPRDGRRRPRQQSSGSAPATRSITCTSATC